MQNQSGDTKIHLKEGWFVSRSHLLLFKWLMICYDLFSIIIINLTRD